MLNITSPPKKLTENRHIENGDILKHKINEPLARLASSADVSALQAFKADWQNIANQINGISEAMQGQNAPSGTAWRLFEAQLQESHSLFPTVNRLL